MKPSLTPYRTQSNFELLPGRIHVPTNSAENDGSPVAFLLMLSAVVYLSLGIAFGIFIVHHHILGVR